MLCPQKITPLGCATTGVGFTLTNLTAASTTLELKTGQGVQFPAPVTGESFWMDVGGCTPAQCVRVQVTARSGDVLTIVPPVGFSGCISGNARAVYAATSPEHIRGIASELGFTVVPPLKWDCTTRTLSLDCEALKDMVFQPCGI